jgi:shikimate 5-dehydrogenase
MNILQKIRPLIENDVLQLQESIFALGPEYQPQVNAEGLNYEPLSVIIGEHPSAYAVSPLMWNAEFKLRSAKGLFLPIDISLVKAENLEKLLDVAFTFGAKNFRVLTITNPYKIRALEYFQDKAKKFSNRVVISADAERIGATNQILIGPNNVFHVINSDGQGMARAIDTYLNSMGLSDLKDKNVGVIGAGGAALGIIDELVKQTAGRGSVTIFNRTVEKAVEAARKNRALFPDAKVFAHPLDDLALIAPDQDVLVSSITEGDPLFDHHVYELLPSGTLIVDANYGAKSALAGNAKKQAPKNNLAIYDGSGMVVEGYIIPSKALSKLWGYDVSPAIYKKIGSLFGYKPKL